MLHRNGEEEKREKSGFLHRHCMWVYARPQYLCKKPEFILEANLWSAGIIKSWKSVKTTISSGCDLIALIDIWRGPRQEEKMMKSRVVIGTKCRPSRRCSMRRKTLKNHMWSTKILFGNQDRVRLRSLHLWAGATRYLMCPSVQFLGVLAS